MTRSKKNSSNTPTSPVVDITQSRHIHPATKLQLFVRAGGRCEFDGCNRYLLEHHVTHTVGNYAEMAHIVAFKEDGPRGQDPERPENINNLANIMLLCPVCHKEIDDDSTSYPRRVLESYKRQHEDRIFLLTGMKPDQETTVVQLKSKIAGRAVDITFGEIAMAVSPRYPVNRTGMVIDLTCLADEEEACTAAALQTIEKKIQRLYEEGHDGGSSHHLSVFALAPIPLLVYLGSQLSDKMPVILYQRHRDTQTWTWKTDGDPVQYLFHQKRVGTDASQVALVLSLSGVIPPEILPANIDSRCSIIEITLKDQQPEPSFLRLYQDLVNFEASYRAALRAIMRDHPTLRELHLFPAVPAPAAIICGRNLFPKVDPVLLVYDNDKTKGGFTLKVKVNQYGD